MSHTTCDRIPTATPAQKAAPTSARLVVAASVIASTATAAANPVLSLSGRAAVNQYNGDVIVSAVAATRHQVEGSPPTRRNSAAIAHAERPGRDAHRGERLRFGRDDSVGAFRQEDEQRVSRWMRLMLRDVELRHREQS